MRGRLVVAGVLAGSLALGGVALANGRGNDTIYWSRHRDVLDGGRGDDILYGRRGADVLRGGPGADVLFGGRGRDVCYTDAEDVAFSCIEVG